MCTYKEISNIYLPNGQTACEANQAASREIERIYTDSWNRGVSVPFFDNNGNTYLANPDGSEDRVKLDHRSRTYRILRRTAAPGKGRYSHLISQ
ncbi:MAG: xenobiotic reductase B [Prevotella sp.]|nr:xenobiotic reductase B [Prevotella sp.]